MDTNNSTPASQRFYETPPEIFEIPSTPATAKNAENLLHHLLDGKKTEKFMFNFDINHKQRQRNLVPRPRESFRRHTTYHQKPDTPILESAHRKSSPAVIIRSGDQRKNSMCPASNFVLQDISGIRKRRPTLTSSNENI